MFSGHEEIYLSFCSLIMFSGQEDHVGWNQHGFGHTSFQTHPRVLVFPRFPPLSALCSVLWYPTLYICARNKTPLPKSDQPNPTRWSGDKSDFTPAWTSFLRQALYLCKVPRCAHCLMWQLCVHFLSRECQLVFVHVCFKFLTKYF